MVEVSSCPISEMFRNVTIPVICITIALLITLATPLKSHVRSDGSHVLNQMRNDVEIYAKQQKHIKQLPQESLTICVQACVRKEMFQIS